MGKVISKRRLAKIQLEPILPISPWAARDATDYDISARSADWCTRLCRTANWNFHGDTLSNVQISLAFGPANTQNVYFWTGTNGKKRRTAGRPQFPNSALPPQIISGEVMVPYVDGMRTATGPDGQSTIVDLTTGIMFNPWGLSLPWDTYPWLIPSTSFPFVAPNPLYGASSDNPLGYRPQLHGYLTAGFDPTAWAVAADMEIIHPDDQGNADVNSPFCRMNEGIMQPEEIIAALAGDGIMGGFKGLTVSGRCSMTGPIAGPEIQDPDHPDVGRIVGCSTAPARLLESAHILSTPAQLAGMVCDGQLFNLLYSDAEVEAQLTANGLTGALRDSTRVIVNTARFKGIRTFATSGPDGPAQLITNGSPHAMPLWASLGFTGPKSANALHGFFTPDHMVARRAPLVTLAKGGTTRREGLASSIP